ncbi:MAG: universal stress protein [Planctomycetota bacterium]|nr:universal stress protein [Planctomycetota bacterium]
MIHLNRILITTDLTEDSAIALNWAHLLGRPFNSRMALACVVSPPHVMIEPELALAGALPPPVNMDEQMVRAAAQMGRMVRQRLPDFEVELHPITSFSAEAGLLELVRKEHFDLIVMAVHGKPSLSHFLFSSTSEQMIQEAKVPVLCLRERADSIQHRIRVRRILCPVDFFEDYLESVKNGYIFARAFNAEMHLLHVAPEPAESFGWAYESEEVLLERLVDFVPDEYKRGTSTRHHVMRGSASHRINDFADENDIDLIVMSTHGHHGIMDYFFGSNSEQVLRHSRHAVLVCPAEKLTAEMPVMASSMESY